MWMPKLLCGYHGEDPGSLTYSQSYTKDTGKRTDRMLWPYSRDNEQGRNL